MKFRKFGALVLMSTALLSGCDKTPKTKLLSNSDFLLYGEIDDSHLFYKPTVEEFGNLYNSNLNFVVMFTQEGCSACIEFEPIIKEYVKETHQLVLNISGDIYAPIVNQYFTDFDVKTPQIFIKENSPKFYMVDYASYMKTYKVFKRHMDSRYETAKYSYFCGKIAGKSPIFSNFTQVDFISNDTFKNVVYSKAISSQNNVVFSSNFSAQSLSILNSDFSVTKTVTIDENLTDEIVAQYL